jgi:YCII-related domain-containing protein
MTDYVLLFSGGRMPETESEQADVMKGWTAWFEELGPALKDGGNPFTPGAAKTIAPDGTMKDGAGSASGYSIVTADSLDAATEIAKGCPVLRGGASIEVYETFAVR